MLLLLSFFLQKYMTSTEITSKSRERTTQAEIASPVETLPLSGTTVLPLSVVGWEVSSGAVSICAITSILPSVCTASAIKVVVKSTEHTATNSKHRYLNIFIHFILDKTCVVNYKGATY